MISKEIIIVIIVIILIISSIIGGVLFYTSETTSKPSVSTESQPVSTESQNQPIGQIQPIGQLPIGTFPPVSTESQNQPVFTTTPIPKLIPFTLDSKLYTTGMNSDGGGNAHFLDRHYINCKNEGLNQFNLLRNPTTSEYEFEYSCVNENNQFGAPILNETVMNADGGGNTVYLDRHNATCTGGSIMTSLHLQRNIAGDEFQLQYNCAPPLINTPLFCRQTTTPFNADGSGSTFYLDRHNISCNPNEALTEVHLQRDSTNTEYQFQYKCCQLPIGTIPPVSTESFTCLGAYASYNYIDNSEITSPTTLHTCQGIKSANGNHNFVMQSDNNAVIYNTTNGDSLWTTGTNGKGTSPLSFIYQTDGNLILSDNNNKSYWASNTNGKGSTGLIMQTDGNLVLYNGTTPVWASGTNGK